MNPEILSGTVLGTYTIQHRISGDGLGILFHAQQVHSSQRVALKVLLPPTTHASEQRTLFLQRFRHDMPLVTSLEHSHILRVQEFGEHEDVPYLVMPCHTGGTLRDVLVKEGQLSWPTIVSYLEQLASALDYAHERGVLHRNVQPGNVLLTADGNLVVTDFRLVDIATAGMTPQELLLGTAGPRIMPDYIAPEQVLGEPVDGRADLYSLAVMLYHMVTGKTPFQGTTAVYIAAQQVQVPPPSLRTLRPDVPPGAEQVLLRAMAKKASDRYDRAQDFADAFRAALLAAGITLSASMGQVPVSSASPVQDVKQPATDAIPLWSKRLRSEQKTGALHPTKDAMKTPGTFTRNVFTPATSAEQLPFPASSSSLTGKLFRPSERITTASLERHATAPTSPLINSSTTQSANTTRVLPELQHVSTSTTDAQSAITATPGPLFSFPGTGTMDALRVSSEQGNTGTTVKLTDAMKIVQVPVAGQPGRYMTGFLPAVSTTEEPSIRFPLPGTIRKRLKGQPAKRMKVAGIIALVALVLLSSFMALYIHGRTSQPVPANAHHVTATPDVMGTISAHATATVQANIILLDPLSENIHNWPIQTAGNKEYFFSGGTYHIFDNANGQSAPSILNGESIVGPMVYSLTMQEIKGNDTSLNNSFGMIFRFTTSKKGSQTITTFYTFQVVNMKGGQYQFWKYDSSRTNPWIPLWKHASGGEFHWGHAAQSINTFKVSASGKSFTFTVNGKVVGTQQDSSIASGAIGMLVNLKGTEVAFSDLSLTHQ